MRDLKFYFSDRRMVTQLCRKRIALARKNRQGQFPARAAGLPVNSEQMDDPWQRELRELLPPRRHWPHATRRERCESKDRAETAVKTLTWYVLRALSEDEPTYSWTKRLRRFLDGCKRDALSWDGSMVHKPRSIVPIPKERPGSGQKYRVVVTYSLRDGIIASGFAAYLGNAIDGALGDCCFASRPRQNGKAKSHHDAVVGFREFAGQISKQTALWVAECDIQGFFDSVPHKVARARLRTMSAKTGATLDKRASAFLTSFLAGYDYLSARKKATRQLRAQHVDRPILFKPKATLVKAGIEFDSQERHGIPQGSPLSGVIANAVLAAADDACLNELRGNGRWHYARYCDDILLVSTDRGTCRLALRAYRRELRRLGLAHHRAVKVLPYCGRNMKRFWEGKSKRPYLWRSGETGPGVPWIGFLGYQLKRDGMLRIRRASIQREIAKQRKAVDDVIRCIRSARAKVPHRASHQIAPTRRIEHRVLMHLVAMGVGFPSGHSTSPPPYSLSWCNAYPLLQSGPVDLAPLEDLDRGRTLAMKVLRGKLVALVNTSNDNVDGDLRHASEEAMAPRSFCLRFAGYPLSYYGQFPPAQRTAATPVTTAPPRADLRSAQAEKIAPKWRRITTPQEPRLRHKSGRGR
jgi:hypothetical protein